MLVLDFLILLTAAVALYLRFIRPWQVRWGATDGEIDRSMAGDEVVKAPILNATRAVTIQANFGDCTLTTLSCGATTESAPSTNSLI